MSLKPLSAFLNEPTIEALRAEIRNGRFPGVSFEQAMQFLLTDGIVPASHLPTASFLALEDWVRGRGEAGTVSYTTTELKNKTGEIVEAVLRGKTVRLFKHGRAIAEIKKIAG